MDNDTLYLTTVYKADGLRVELDLKHSLEDAESTGKAHTKHWGEGATYKIWKASEVKTNATV